MPLDVLESEIDAWIAAERAQVVRTLTAAFSLRQAAAPDETGMKLLLAAALLTLPSAAQARDDDVFCQDVRRLARAAKEAPPFHSLVAENFRPRLLAHGCSHNMRGGYTCSQTFAPRGLTRESVAGRIRACLPGATLTVRRDYLHHELIVSRGRFTASVAEHGAERAHVGRIITLYIDAPRANPR